VELRQNAGAVNLKLRVELRGVGAGGFAAPVVTLENNPSPRDFSGRWTSLALGGADTKISRTGRVARHAVVGMTGCSASKSHFCGEAGRAPPEGIQRKLPGRLFHRRFFLLPCATPVR